VAGARPVAAQPPALQVAPTAIHPVVSEGWATDLLVITSSFGNLAGQNLSLIHPSGPAAAQDWLLWQQGDDPRTRGFRPDRVEYAGSDVFSLRFRRTVTGQDGKSYTLDKNKPINLRVTLNNTANNTPVVLPVNIQGGAVLKIPPSPPAVQTNLPVSAGLWLPFLASVEFAPKAQTLDDNERFAVRLPIDVVWGNVFRTTPDRGRFAFDANALVSTERNDTAGGYALGGNYHEAPASSLSAVRWEGGLNLRGNQANTDQSVVASAQLLANVRALSGRVPSGPGSFAVIQVPTAPTLRFAPILYENWIKKDTRLTEGHAKDGLFYSRGSLDLAPLFLLGGRNVAARRKMISFEAKATGYYFANETAVPDSGVSAQRWLGAAEFIAYVPLRGLRLNVPGFETNVFAFTFGIGKRVNETSNFAVERTPLIGFTIF
jgi:hypothetical protein